MSEFSWNKNNKELKNENKNVKKKKGEWKYLSPGALAAVPAVGVVDVGARGHFLVTAHFFRQFSPKSSTGFHLNIDHIDHSDTLSISLHFTQKKNPLTFNLFQLPIYSVISHFFIFLNLNNQII